jgi:DNA replication protein DnaC
VSSSPPPLAADLNDGLKRLKMAAMRRLAPELLVTARTQRWNPEELLRTLVEAEITARDESNARTRMRSAAFPVIKSLTEFDLAASSIPRATFDYLASLEWIRAAENCCLIGPAGTGKSHILVALGVAAVEAGHRVRYFTAAELVETLYRALADNSVGRVIENLLRNDMIICDELGFAPLDDTGAQLLFRFVAAAYERRSLGIGSHWPFESWGRFRAHHRRQHARPTTAPLPRCRHRRRLLPHETSPSKRRRNPNNKLINPLLSGDIYLATSGDPNLAVDKWSPSSEQLMRPRQMSTTECSVMAARRSESMAVSFLGRDEYAARS